MNECESEYIKTLEDYVKKGLLPEKAAMDVMSCVESMTEHQCFEFVMIDMFKKNYASGLSIDVILNFEVIWYVNMLCSSKAGCSHSNHISAYTISKLLLCDLINFWNDQSLVLCFMNIDEDGTVSNSEVAQVLKNSDVVLSNWFGEQMDRLWKKWSVISEDVNRCFIK